MEISEQTFQDVVFSRSNPESLAASNNLTLDQRMQLEQIRLLKAVKGRLELLLLGIIVLVIVGLIF